MALYPIFRSCQPAGLSQLSICSRLRGSHSFCTISQPPCIRNPGQTRNRFTLQIRSDKRTRLFASASDTEDKSAAPHIPVLLAEILALFHDTHTRVYVDGTLGAGGHASAIVAEHPEMETLIGFDMDPLAHEIAHERLTSIAPEDTTIMHVRSNFRNLSAALSDISPGLEQGGVNAMLLDLGISSMQVDTADRGFSFGADGPIDMRMDPTAILRAEQIVNDYPEAELANIIFKYGEEKRARNIAQR
ncbi:hypothetical protein CYMTET_32543 [Cymbomonas tetramitiformis]|uniref:Uncharacterized protein n=1 Tax=Cymbomonas tetramitiformis TaxID=36881 RepID=A0AAE0KRT5_9CHLO|nr:hypothetical protein CYMTET_32543 [Cymbomonas tetramitiformis]